MAKSLISKRIALSGRERLELFICMRLNPTKDGDERRKRRLIRQVLKIPQANVMISDNGPGNSLLTIGRKVGKVFQRERGAEPDDRLFEITPELAAYLVDKLSAMPADDNKSDVLADLEDKLAQVRDGRYDEPDGTPDYGADADFIPLAEEQRERLMVLRAEVDTIERELSKLDQPTTEAPLPSPTS